MQSEGDLGDDAERSLGSDEETREVVAGRRLARAATGANHPPVGKDHRETQHGFAHRAVADGRGARRARRRHAANRRIGAGIDPEVNAGVGQRLVELAVRDAGFDLAVEIVGADTQHTIHARQINRNATVDGVDVPLERGPDAERHDWRTMTFATRTIALTSSVFVGNTTTSGKPGACHDSP